MESIKAGLTLEDTLRMITLPRLIAVVEDAQRELESAGFQKEEDVLAQVALLKDEKDLSGALASSKYNPLRVRKTAVWDPVRVDGTKIQYTSDGYAGLSDSELPIVLRVNPSIRALVEYIGTLFRTDGPHYIDLAHIISNYIDSLKQDKPIDKLAVNSLNLELANAYVRIRKDLGKTLDAVKLWESVDDTELKNRSLDAVSQVVSAWNLDDRLWNYQKGGIGRYIASVFGQTWPLDDELKSRISARLDFALENSGNSARIYQGQSASMDFLWGFLYKDSPVDFSAEKGNFRQALQPLSGSSHIADATLAFIDYRVALEEKRYQSVLDNLDKIHGILAPAIGEEDSQRKKESKAEFLIALDLEKAVVYKEWGKYEEALRILQRDDMLPYRDTMSMRAEIWDIQQQPKALASPVVQPAQAPKAILPLDEILLGVDYSSDELNRIRDMLRLADSLSADGLPGAINLYSTAQKATEDCRQNANWDDSKPQVQAALALSGYSRYKSLMAKFSGDSSISQSQDFFPLLFNAVSYSIVVSNHIKKSKTSSPNMPNPENLEASGLYCLAEVAALKFSHTKDPTALDLPIEILTGKKDEFIDYSLLRGYWQAALRASELLHTKGDYARSIEQFDLAVRLNPEANGAWVADARQKLDELASAASMQHPTGAHPHAHAGDSVLTGAGDSSLNIRGLTTSGQPTPSAGYSLAQIVQQLEIYRDSVQGFRESFRSNYANYNPPSGKDAQEQASIGRIKATLERSIDSVNSLVGLSESALAQLEGKSSLSELSADAVAQLRDVYEKVKTLQKQNMEALEKSEYEFLTPQITSDLNTIMSREHPGQQPQGEALKKLVDQLVSEKSAEYTQLYANTDEGRIAIPCSSVINQTSGLLIPLLEAILNQASSQQRGEAQPPQPRVRVIGGTGYTPPQQRTDAAPLSGTADDVQSLPSFLRRNTGGTGGSATYPPAPAPTQPTTTQYRTIPSLESLIPDDSPVRPFFDNYKAQLPELRRTPLNSLYQELHLRLKFLQSILLQGGIGTSQYNNLMDSTTLEMARVHILAGKSADAQKILSDAKLDQQPAALAFIGDVYAEKKKYTDAKAAYEQARALDSSGSVIDLKGIEVKITEMGGLLDVSAHEASGVTLMQGLTVAGQRKDIYEIIMAGAAGTTLQIGQCIAQARQAPLQRDVPTGIGRVKSTAVNLMHRQLRRGLSREELYDQALSLKTQYDSQQQQAKSPITDFMVGALGSYITLEKALRCGIAADPIKSYQDIISLAAAFLETYMPLVTHASRGSAIWTRKAAELAYSASLQKAELELERKQAQEALASLDLASRLNPEDRYGEVAFIAGKAYLQQGKYPEAVNELETAGQKASERSYQLPGISLELASAHRNFAGTLTQPPKDFQTIEEEVLKAWDKGVRLYSTGNTADLSVSKREFQSVLDRLGYNPTSGALNEFTAQQQIASPQDIEAMQLQRKVLVAFSLQYLGNISLREQNPASAMEYVNRSLGMLPTRNAEFFKSELYQKAA